MIGKITGRVDYRGTDHVLVDVQGVGYMVYCSERTLTGLPSRGGVVALYTDLLVREDNLQLFGFTSLADKEWHKLLTTVQGVGAKAALAIASTLGTEGISRAIALGDVSAIKSAQGIGPKIAQRIATELKDKAPKIMAMGGEGSAIVEADVSMVIDVQTPVDVPFKAQNKNSEAGAQADALSALINLGYGHGDAAGAIAEASNETLSSIPTDLIKAALKLLAPKGR
ncbi:Holliday junction branch migration protein RuvA [Amylibacter sp.]|jgi:Holliday junction DNA helicase RuvA|nr:Holliday junction branch migration protein RuvA [Amylibacter sp.]MDA8760036.1 Holliday junction branch migration protein RuvA [Amylibacter sp.]MDA9242500.1 Holliday junction branch migration protein RuvA [Amylibacter sp.]MDA9313685.1 Holliday junction branch migration protein RuvA [Amylibacter sp.]MDA9355519.1 Holliday junction branch migration protein RuvA [Amylibacter sp.]|tara:strand:- start:3534 stop:4211 length:678 start_codon:yes stop_codon:yes gene_type:complete